MDQRCLPADWGWKVTRPSGRGFDDDPVDYAASLRDRRTILIEEAPGIPLRRRKQPWHRAAPHASGADYLPFTTEIPFGLWIFTLVPNDDEERSGRTWSQRIWSRVPAWWALGPQGLEAAALLARLNKLTWDEVLTLRRSYNRAWPTDREDPAWYEAQDLATTANRAQLKNALIKYTETALGRIARAHGKRVRDFSDEQKAVCFAAAALAIEDLSPSLAHRLLGPLRLALGDVHAYPVPGWADSV
ncbi:predicted protein [Streptomyces sp. SPB78]|uniref:hypothetical protein n=1 Tax=Streptomyces sp. (strain SPB78) TaxID=591157 RepID=UPI0001DEE11D|nr:hypothetical protein [Streptomyces sp. SPB78]EFL04324.1 predicted protein [Streptomyces sp. SPB78]